MNDDDGQKTTFPKKGPTDDAAGVANTGRKGDTKELGMGDMPMIKAGGASSSGSGPTGSPRSYPKGGKPSMDASKFNPMNDKANTYAVGGVGKGED
jgi:hypothetical protein